MINDIKEHKPDIPFIGQMRKIFLFDDDFDVFVIANLICAKLGKEDKLLTC